MNNVFIDTHAHLYDPAFEGEEEEVVGRALAAGVKIILQPDIDSSERDGMLKLGDRFPEVFRNMAGLYPGSVEENWEEEVEKVKECAVNHNVIAIGEIGLDYHERDATEDFFRVLEECRHLGVRGNMHAFSGSYETFMRLQKYGDWSVGIGGVVTFKNAGVAESVKKIPLEKILLETDSPYLTPMPFRGKRNESSYIPLIARKVAELKDTDLGEVAAKTTENACKLFRISI